MTAFDMELDAQNGIVLLCTAMLPCSGSRSHKECENHVHSFELSHLITYPWNDTVVKASENRFDTKTSESVTPCGICGGKIALGQVFLQVLRVSPVNFFPPVLHY